MNTNLNTKCLAPTSLSTFSRTKKINVSRARVEISQLKYCSSIITEKLMVIFVLESPCRRRVFRFF
eukprot:UN16009